MGLLSSDDTVEKVTKSKEYTEHTAKVEWVDEEEPREYVFDAMKRKDGAIVLKDFMETRNGSMELQAWLTLPEQHIREFKTIKRETKEIQWEEEKSHSCPHCGKKFTDRGLKIHKANNHPRRKIGPGMY